MGRGYFTYVKASRSLCHQGECWKAYSGSIKREGVKGESPLPDGVWTVSTSPYYAGVKPNPNNRTGEFYHITNGKNPMLHNKNHTTKRSQIGIHSDDGDFKTHGCIGVDVKDWPSFRKHMQKLRGKGSIPIVVAQSSDALKYGKGYHLFKEKFGEHFAKYVVNLVEEERAKGTPHLTTTLVYYQMKQESNFNPKAVSYVGAQGLMQLMPATAKYLGVKDPFNSYQNTRGGVRYLAKQLRRFNDVKLALAAYNAGPERVASLGRVPRIKETQHYVQTITRNV